MPNTTSPQDKPSRLRGALLITLVVALIAGGVGTALLLRGGDDKADPQDELDLRHPEDYGVTPAQAKCGVLEKPKYQGRIKLTPGEAHPPYASDPPTSGWFVPPVHAGTYGSTTLPPIERLMSIPANGGVLIWVAESSYEDARKWHNLMRSDDLVVAVDGEVAQGAVFVAWGRMQRCEAFSGQFASDFFARWGKMKAVHELEPGAEPEYF